MSGLKALVRLAPVIFLRKADCGGMKAKATGRMPYTRYGRNLFTVSGPYLRP